jgi:hypothetical protein
VAYPCATSPYKIYKPTGNKPDIELEDCRRLHQSGPILNTLDWDKTVEGASQAVSYDAMCKQQQHQYDRNMVWRSDTPKHLKTPRPISSPLRRPVFRLPNGRRDTRDKGLETR